MYGEGIRTAMALQRGSATALSAVMFTTNTVVPSLISLLVLGDQVRSGYIGPAIAGFVPAVSGAIAVTYYADLAAGRATARSTEPGTAGPVRAPLVDG